MLVLKQTEDDRYRVCVGGHNSSVRGLEGKDQRRETMF